MPFFKLKGRNKPPSTSTVIISNPIPANPNQRPSVEQSPEQQQQSDAMDVDGNRRSPPTPLKLRGNYHPVNTASRRKRIPSSPLPPLPHYESGDELGSPYKYSDGEYGYARGIAKFDRVRTNSEDTTTMLSPRTTALDRSSTDTDTLTEFVPTATSPPKLKLSFESNVTEAGSVYDLDTPPNHRVSLKSTFKPLPKTALRQRSPERIITAPVKASPTNTTSPDPRPRPRTSSSGGVQLRRSSAVYKRRMSNEATDTTASIKSGKSTISSPEDRDSGFHEDFDEALRSKQPSPDKQSFPVKNDNVHHQREITASPDRGTFVITPERAPLIPSEGRITPITLSDPGITSKPLTLPQIERMETFKETFSTNLFENTISPDAKRTLLLSPKPIVPAAKGKVVTAAEFEKLRQQAAEDSEEDSDDEDVIRDENYEVDLAKQRQRQQAALSIYRQQMTKVVGATASPNLAPQRPLSRVGEGMEIPDETEEIPLGILMAHGFPQTNSRPSSSHSQQITLEPKRTPSPGNLPVFAKNLPADPHAMGLPRSSSSYELRQNTRNSFGGPLMGGRLNSAPAVPLLNSYQTRERRGAMFLDPNASVEPQSPWMQQDQGYFNQVPVPPIPAQFMGMQSVPGQGMVQYVPVMVPSPSGSPSLGPMQPPTLIHELHQRQQIGFEQRQLHRTSQYTSQPSYPNNRYSQMPVTRPQSIYPDARRSVYDQKSIYSNSSQQPTARPKLPSSNPAHRMSVMSNSSSARYRASTYAGTGLGVTSQSRRVSPSSLIDDDTDGGWESLRRKKEEMQMRRMTRLQTAA